MAFVLLGSLIGMYPLNANDCPFIPLAIRANIMDEGPTSGTTSILCLWACWTIAAPGSATHGSPASEITPQDRPAFITGSNIASICVGSVCSDNSTKVI